MAQTAIALDSHVYESAMQCSAALGQSVTEWLNNAAKAAARRQNAAAYAAWENGRDELDLATERLSLDGAGW